MLLEKMYFIKRAMMRFHFPKPVIALWDDLILDVSDRFWGKLATKNGLNQKYTWTVSNEKIGTKVYMFWYTGFDNAPSVVKKCAQLVGECDGVDLILLDKNNLDQYFAWEGRVRKLWESGKLSVQLLSDVVRHQLISRWGGVWIDATCFVTDRSFFLKHSTMEYFSIRHHHDNHFPSYGKWSMWLSAGGRGNLIFSYLYDLLIAYLNKYDKPFTYLLAAHAYLYIYNHNAYAKAHIDALPFEVDDGYFLQNNYFNQFNADNWQHMMEKNSIQKLTYRKPVPEGCQFENTYAYYFQTKFEYEK